MQRLSHWKCTNAAAAAVTATATTEINHELNAVSVWSWKKYVREKPKPPPPPPTRVRAHCTQFYSLMQMYRSPNRYHDTTTYFLNFEIKMITVSVLPGRADAENEFLTQLIVRVTDGKSQLHRMRSHRYISALRCIFIRWMLWLLLLLGGFNPTHWFYCNVQSHFFQSHRFFSVFIVCIYQFFFSRFPVHFHKCTYCFELADKYAP